MISNNLICYHRYNLSESIVGTFFDSNLKSYFIQLFRRKIKMRLVRDVAGIFTTLVVGYVGYKTLRIYLLRRKYRHIPGPPTKGIKGFFLGNIAEIQMNSMQKRILTDLYCDW